MPRDDLRCDAESQSGTAILGGEERIEDLLTDVVRHSPASVRHPNDRHPASLAVVRGLPAHLDRAMRHGFQGVVQQVYEDLPQLAGIHHDRRRVLRHGARKPNAFFLTSASQQVGGPPDNIAKVARLELERRGTRELEKVADDAFETPDLFRDNAELPVPFRIARDCPANGEQPHLHGRKRIADLVGDAGCQTADGGQFLGDRKPQTVLLQAAPRLSNVRHQQLQMLARFVHLIPHAPPGGRIAGKCPGVGEHPPQR